VAAHPSLWHHCNDVVHRTKDTNHNATQLLSPHIIDLDTICLKHTNIIEKKKDSSTKLINKELIPRSLRIKCDLTTSPDFENDPNYIILKRELQTAVSHFIATGMEIMKKWSIINIDLLIKDRCNIFMKKAISILDGLYSYWENVIGPANSTNDIKTNILLLMLKIYLETDYIPNMTEITNFFEIPSNKSLFDYAPRSSQKIQMTYIINQFWWQSTKYNSISQSTTQNNSTY
jgi:hypothetical protein